RVRKYRDRLLTYRVLVRALVSRSAVQDGDPRTPDLPLLPGQARHRRLAPSPTTSPSEVRCSWRNRLSRRRGGRDRRDPRRRSDESVPLRSVRPRLDSRHGRMVGAGSARLARTGSSDQLQELLSEALVVVRVEIELWARLE